MDSLSPNFDIGSLTLEEVKKDAESSIIILQDLEHKELNTFPVSAFPERVQQIINALSECLQYPTDFTASSMLYAVSLAIGNTHKVQVMSTWMESALLYIALVGAPGTAKSHPQTFALEPIIDRDSRAYREYQRLNQEYLQAASLTRKERESAGIDEPVKPVWQKHLVQDFTPEALTEVHKYNKRGIGVYADELASWFKNFNRYSKGSEQEFWLSNWSAKPIIIDRKSGEPTFIRKPFIPVTGTIQNSILAELGKDGRSQNGFVDRILFAMPEGLKKTYWSENALDPQHLQNWHTILSNLLDLSVSLDETETPQPAVLTFTSEGFARLKQWQRTNTDQCNNAGSEAIAGLHSKLEIYVVRLSLIMQMMQWASGEGDKQAVGLQSVNSAIELAEYFRNTGLKVQRIIYNYNPLDKLPTDKQAMFKALPAAFTTAQGLEIATAHDMAEATYKRFLTDTTLFEKTSYGNYKKNI